MSPELLLQKRGEEPLRERAPSLCRAAARLARSDGQLRAEFHGVETINHPEDGPIRYIKMRSLVEGFDERTLCQMDVKMGVRCFAESPRVARAAEGPL